MAEVEFKANEGSPEQLPRGEAQALNENTNVQPPGEVEAVEALPEEEPEEEVGATMDPSDEELAGPATDADFNPLYEPATEDEQFILGPTTRPDEAETAGTEPQAPISARLRRLLPVLLKAAEEPGASEELKQLVEMVLRRA